jgi:hypothetical protein
MTDTVRCPHCGKNVEISDALAHGIRERVLQEELPKIEKQRKDLEDKAASLVSRESNLDSMVAAKLAEEKKTLTQTLKAEIQRQNAEEVSALQSQLADKDKEVSTLKRNELELRRVRQELEAEKADLALTVQRKLDEERSFIEEKVAKRISDENQQKELQSQHRISELQSTVETLKRKLEQSSQQSQGEALEVKLEEVLRATFPMDIIEPVEKGVRGADVKQTVRNSMGQVCGIILWESKSTKSWSDTWVQKLKDNALDAKADISIILTTALPKTIENFGLVDGSIWATDYGCFKGLAHSLRHAILAVAQTRFTESRRQDTQSQLYDYLTSHEFKNRMEAILGPFLSMQKDLESEIRTTQTRWAKRKKQLDRVITGVAGFQGELEAVIGEPFKQLKPLDVQQETDDSEHDVD